MKGKHLIGSFVLFTAMLGLSAPALSQTIKDVNVLTMPPVNIGNTPLDVNVANTPNVTVANPVQVQGTVNISPGPLNPYQEQVSVPDSSTCGNTCNFDFPVVPDGYRLVLTHVAAQLGATASVVVVEAGNATLFASVPYAGSSYVSAPVTFYVDAGSIPSARIFRPDPSAPGSEIVTLIGYLVPVE